MQTTSNILLIRPSGFIFNTETAGSNTFQKAADMGNLNQQAQQEFDGFAHTLIRNGMNVMVIQDTPLPQKPDAVFPNNWGSFHSDGTVILYPMLAQNRRYEKRSDIIEQLKQKFIVNRVIDLSEYELQNRFLEGTGSILYDHQHKIAYACISPRTDKALFIRVCELLGYRPICFTAHDKNGTAIYHTNVMMCLGEKFSSICLSSISDPKERAVVIHSLTDTGHEIIDITFHQMENFAGNMLELKPTKGVKNILALSQSALNSLNDVQIGQIEKYCSLIPLAIPTIETIGGGSARCMIAEIFLQPINE